MIQHLTPWVPAALVMQGWVDVRRMCCSSPAAHMSNIHPSEDTFLPSWSLIDAFPPGYPSFNELFLCQKITIMWCHMVTIALRGLMCYLCGFVVHPISCDSWLRVGHLASVTSAKPVKGQRLIPYHYAHMPSWAQPNPPAPPLAPHLTYGSGNIWAREVRKVVLYQHWLSLKVDWFLFCNQLSIIQLTWNWFSWYTIFFTLVGIPAQSSC